MIQLHISEAAALSIIEQSDYYSLKLDVALALSWESAVDEAVNSLLKWPERGAACHFKSSAISGLRWIFIPGFPKHMLFYRYHSDTQLLFVLQVIHGSRDIEAILDADD